MSDSPAHVAPAHVGPAAVDDGIDQTWAGADVTVEDVRAAATRIAPYI